MRKTSDESRASLARSLKCKYFAEFIAGISSAMFLVQSRYEIVQYNSTKIFSVLACTRHVPDYACS